MTRDTDYAITRESLMGTNYEPDYSGVLSFLRRKYSRDLSNVDVAVTGIPYDLSVTNRPGTRFGPRALREASSLLNNGPIPDWGFDPFDKIAVVDYGDCGVDSSVPESIPDEIETHIKSGFLARFVAL